MNPYLTRWRWLLPSALLGLAACSPAVAPPKTVDCPSLQHGCRFDVSGNPLELRLSREPSGLAPFEVLVLAPKAREMAAGFQMEGMDMGDIRYRLNRRADAWWHGTVLLPLCVSGQSNWLLTLDIDGARVNVPFVLGKS